VYGEKKKEELLYTEEDEQRMDIIGQNGNDGIHYEEEVVKEVEEKATIKPGKGAFKR
jgi:hypothetical protein